MARAGIFFRQWSLRKRKRNKYMVEKEMKVSDHTGERKHKGHNRII
jgi:hypothetical protein